MIMKNLITAALVVAAMTFVMACGLLDKALDSATNMTQVNEMWPDVPVMDGMTRSEIEMPAATKLILRTIIGNMGLLNKEGESRSTGDIDWTSYTGDKTPSDVRAFYTNERMADAGGWATQKNPPCIDGKDKGLDGVLCVFQKKSGSKQAGLLILAVADEKTGKTTAYYLRIEGEAAPANN
jgi:hypothetical protein